MPVATRDIGKNDASLDLRHYLLVVWKRRWSCMAVVVVTFASAVIFTWSQVPIFQATAVVLIDPEPPKLVSNVQDVVPVFATDDYYATQLKLIQTRAVVEGAIGRIRLKERLPWLAGVSDPYRAIAGSLIVDPIKNTRLVQVKFENPDPRVAADVANGVANEYVRYSLETKHKLAQEALVWLNEQLAGLRTQTQQSSKALQAYQARADLVGLKEQSQIAQSKLVEANRAYLDAQNQRLTIEVKLREMNRFAQDPKAAETVSTTLVDDPSIRKLKGDVSDLMTERAKLAQVYKEKHPDLQTLDAQIKQVNLRLHAELQKMLRTVETEQKAAKAREDSLANRVVELRSEARRLIEREGQALGLEWEKDSNEALHGVVLKRLKETGIATMLEASNVRVVEMATPPNFPAKPKKELIWTLSIIAGVALGIGMAFLAESLDNCVRSRADIERLGLPVLGIVPVFDGRRRSHAGQSRS